MNILHSHLILHNHICLANIRMREDGRLYLASFEHSSKLKFMGQSAVREPPDGKFSHIYLSPEVLLGIEEETTTNDIWAVGCIFYYMLAGYHPFK